MNAYKMIGSSMGHLFFPSVFARRPCAVSEREVIIMVPYGLLDIAAPIVVVCG